MSIEKRGTGYRVRWRDAAGKPHSRQVQRHRDAVRLDGELKRMKATGELKAFDRGKETLAAFAELWWRRYALVNLAPRTRENYAFLYDKHVLPALGGFQIRDIDPGHVSELSSVLSKTLSPATVRKVLIVLQGILARAVEWQHIGTNPAAAVKKPTPKSRVPVPLTSSQVEAIKLGLDQRGATVVALLAGTGIRPGEMRALQWVHVLANTLVIEQAVSKDRLGPTKTGQRRAVVLTPELRQILREWRLACGRPRGGYVFPGRNGGVWTDNGWRQWQRTHFKDAAPEGVVPYDLRHTWVSQMIRDGRNVQEIAAQAGHSPTMTLNVYGHLFADQRVQPTDPQEPHADHR